ncbi:hypothetical protein ERO13_1Z049549v2 [Gossypium hirsutum]|nr:hypothetical protein ERO13_1Z049549v2 [Gossypium hirsutum]
MLVTSSDAGPRLNFQPMLFTSCSMFCTYFIHFFSFFSLIKIYVCGCGSSGLVWFAREKNVLRAKLGTASPPQSSSSHHQAVGRWGEGEKAFPLKKRRGSRSMKSSTSKMKTKLSKKLVQQQQQSNGEEQESKDIACTNVDYNNNNSSGAKKRGRGGALMEGSRCSRVNGRGWRCCQQTLVGYSLCEHHLGKGRLRSMTSVRSRSLAAKEEGQPNNGDNQAKRELHGESGGNDAEGEDQKPLMMTKKRAKLGMVKARSIIADDSN